MVGERQKEGEGMTKEEEEARMVVATIREGREGKRKTKRSQCIDLEVAEIKERGKEG